MFSSCNIQLFAVRNIHYPVNTSSDHFHTDAVVPSSDHCCNERVLSSSDHYCTDTVAPSGRHCFTDTVSPSSDHYCVGIVVPSRDHYSTNKVAPPSDHSHPKITSLLFLWLFPSSGVAAMVVDRVFPVSPVSFIALSQSYTPK